MFSNVKEFNRFAVQYVVDHNGDGDMSDDELKQFRKEADRDDDGKISDEEKHYAVRMAHQELRNDYNAEFGDGFGDGFGNQFGDQFGDFGSISDWIAQEPYGNSNYDYGAPFDHGDMFGFGGMYDTEPFFDGDPLG